VVPISARPENPVWNSRLVVFPDYILAHPQTSRNKWNHFIKLFLF
jgi:hypothetical protein